MRNKSKKQHKETKGITGFFQCFQLWKTRNSSNSKQSSMFLLRGCSSVEIVPLQVNFQKQFVSKNVNNTRSDQRKRDFVVSYEATPFGPQTMVSFRGPKQRTRSSSMGSMPSILLRLSLWPSLLAAWRLKGTMLELTTTLHYNIKCPTKALSGALVKAFYRAEWLPRPFTAMPPSLTHTHQYTSALLFGS